MTGPKPFNKGLPQRNNCNLDDPYEMFLWCFVALPYVNGGPLIMPIDYYQHVSKRLYDLGLRLTAEPILKYEPPTGLEPNWMSCAGRWVAADETASRDST
jgi:Protein of unknown function (DUF2744)